MNTFTEHTDKKSDQDYRKSEVGHKSKISSESTFSDNRSVALEAQAIQRRLNNNSETVKHEPTQTIQREQWGTDHGVQAPIWANFLGDNTWAAFYNRQEQTQGRASFQTNAKLGLHYTTFGLEYEMIPYDPEHALANTAHINLAHGPGLPLVPDVRNKLVTDSDNVVEYVTPVLLAPSDSAMAKAQIGHAKTLLEALNDAVRPAKTLQQLVARPEMQFTTWNLLPIFGSHKEIDETTDVAKYRGLLEATRDVGDMVINEDILWKRNKKLSEDRGKGGGGMQATILVPMEYAAKYVSTTLAKGTDAESAIRRRAEDKESGQSRVKLDGKKILKEITHGVAADLKNLLLSKIELVLNHQYVVEHQDRFQQEKFMSDALGEAKQKRDTKKVLEIEAVLRPVEEGWGPLYEKIKLLDMTMSKNSSRLDNFHRWHSFVKDEMDVWIRASIADILLALNKVVGKDQREQLISDLNLSAQFQVLRDALSKPESFASIVHLEYHAPPFLGVHPEMPDLRQDTLRKVEIIDGKPWVQVEIRDLTPGTLDEALP